jgi:manganese transport protein
MLAAVATALAEVLGAAIGLQMLFSIPLPVGATLTVAVIAAVTFTNGYRRIERFIIGFVSLIGLAFIFELSLVDLDWGAAGKGWVLPAFPAESLPIILSVLGAVVMPHNIFLHSEIIQSRQWNLESEGAIERQLRYEFLDTLLAMGVGWAINSAMILVAAAVFFQNNVPVSEFAQAQETLRPLLGGAAATVFAVALLLAGFASSVTAVMASGSIFAGIWGEPLDFRDNHSRAGAVIPLVGAVAIIFVLEDPFEGLIWSQVILSLQLPFTIFGLLALTSSRKVMGAHANSTRDNVLLWGTGLVVVSLNLALLVQIAAGGG